MSNPDDEPYIDLSSSRSSSPLPEFDDIDDGPPPLVEVSPSSAAQPTEPYSLDRLGAVPARTVLIVGSGIESSVMLLVTRCISYLTAQKEVLDGKMRRVAFGETVDGMKDTDIEEALSYLTCRIQEITEDLAMLNQILQDRHYTAAQVNAINRIYPPIYQACLEVERSVGARGANAASRSSGTSATESSNRMSQSLANMMNMITSTVRNEMSPFAQTSGFPRYSAMADIFGDPDMPSLDGIVNDVFGDNGGEGGGQSSDEEEDEPENDTPDTNITQVDSNPSQPPQPSLSSQSQQPSLPEGLSTQSNNANIPQGTNRRYIANSYRPLSFYSAAAASYRPTGTVDPRRTYVRPYGGVRTRSNEARRGIGALFEGMIGGMAGGAFGDDVKVPLRISVIDRMPSLNFSNDLIDDKSCPICLNDISEGDEVRYMNLCCKKYIHKKCTYEWWDKEHTCASCGKNLHDLEPKQKKSRDDDGDHGPSNSNVPPETS